MAAQTPKSTRPGQSQAIEGFTRRIVADVTVQIVARVANLGLGVVVTLLLVRGLKSTGFGEWSAIFAISQIAVGIGDLGLNEITVSRAAQDPDRTEQWIGALVSLRFMLSIAMTAASVAATLAILTSTSARVAGVIISAGTLLSGPTAAKIIFQLRVRNDVPMAIMTFNSVIWGVGVAVVALLSGNIVAYAAVFAGTSAITAVITIVLAFKMTTVRLQGVRSLWRPMLRVGIPAGIAGMLVTLYVKLDQILVLNIAGARQAGLYGADYRLLEQVQFIPAAAMTTLFPMIAYAYANSSDRIHSMVQNTAEYLAMASLPILAFTIVAARPIVTLLFGKQFADAATALPMLAGAFVSISFGYVAGHMVVVLELQRRFVAFAAIALVLNVVLNIALIPSYGFIAAAWITVLTEFTVMSLSMGMVLRKIEMKPRFGRLLRTLLASAAMGIATWIARVLGAPFGALVLVALASYPPALFAFRVLTLRELRQLMARQPEALGG